MEHIKVGKNEKILCDIEKAVYIYHSFATAVSQLKYLRFYRRNVWRFWSAVIFYKCNDDTAALQRRVSQTALWHYTLLKVHLQTFLFYINKLKKCEILIYDTLVANERHSKHKALKVQVPSALSCRSCCLRAADPHNSVCQTIILTMGCFECLRKTLKAR